MPDKRIFLSYRREDSAGQSGRLNDRLSLEFGRDSIFMDVDGIPLGTDFVKQLTREVASCDVLLAVIASRWLDLRDENETRRIDDPNDFVRVEIGAALQRDIPVIPILLDGTRIPKADRLPSDMQGLAVRNGLDLRHASFHADLDRLVRELRRRFEVPGESAQPPRLVSEAPAEAVGSDDRGEILPPALMAVTTLRGPWREVLFWGVGSLLGSITAILTGAILSPLINKYKSGLLGTSVDDQAGLTLLIIAAVLSAALYNYFLKGPILIGAALVSNVSISIIFELGQRLGDDHHYSLWLWPVVAVAYLWARLSQPGEQA